MRRKTGDMARFWSACVSAGLIAAAPASAELIRLKSGQEINAKIVKRTEKGVTVDWYGVPVTYWLTDIESIDGEAEAPAVPTLIRPETPAAPVAPLAEADEALAQDVIELSGLTRHLEELQAQTEGGFKGRESDERLKKLTPEQREQFLAILVESFNAERMREDIVQAFRRGFDRAHAEAAAAWMRTDNGRRVDEAEHQTRTKEELELFAAQLEQDPPSSQRIDLARRHLEASRAADAAIEMGVTIATAMARVLDTQGRLKGAEFRDGIKKARDVYNEQYREQIESAVMANFLFMYRQVPDEVLTDYVGFLESGAGQWLVATQLQALSDAMSSAAMEMSRKLLPIFEAAKKKEQEQKAAPAAP